MWSNGCRRLHRFAHVLTAGAVTMAAVLIWPGAGTAAPAPAPSAGGPATTAGVHRSATLANGDRLQVLGGRTASAATFRVLGSADRPAGGYAFASVGGVLQVQPTGTGTPAAVTAVDTGVRPRSAAGAPALAATYPVKLTITSAAAVGAKFMYVWNRSTWAYHAVQGEAASPNGSVALPPGDYFAVARYGYWRQRSYLLTRTFTITNAGATVTFDEKAAKETGLVVDDATARRHTSAKWLAVPGGDMVGFASGGPAKVYVTPFSVPGVSLRLHEVMAKGGFSASVPSPYRYDLFHSFDHTVPATPVAKVATAGLARTVTTLRAQGVDANGVLGTAPLTNGWTGALLESPVRMPSSLTEYVTPGIPFARYLGYGSAEDSLALADRTLPAGATAGEVVGAGPFAPRRAVSGGSTRDGDRLRLDETASFSDAAGNTGFAGRASVTAQLSTGGAVLASVTGVSPYRQGITATVPAGPATYRFDQTVVRKVAWSQLSTRIRSEWVFTSARTPGPAELPLIDVQLAAAGLDRRNRAAAAPVELTARAVARGGAAGETITALELSTDDGKTWSTLPVGTGDRATATVTVPPAAAFVSLRVTATDDRGGSIRRTVTRAFAGPAVAPDETAGATRISGVSVNGGKELTFGTSGTRTFTARFTATDPSGIAGGDLYLYHGSYATPDGVLVSASPADCVKSGNTSATCTASFSADVRSDLARNALAGAWTVAAWAYAADGTGHADRHTAGTVGFKRTGKLTANGTPEPVKKGKTLTISGALTRAGWESWTFQAYAARPVLLQFLKAKTTAWKTVKTVQTDAGGKLKTTVKAASDGSWRFSYPGDAASSPVTSTADYVDVK